MNRFAFAAAFLSLTFHGLDARADWESSLFPSDYTIESSLPKAIQTAIQTNKHVIVYYTRTSCPPCNLLQGFLRNDEVRSMYSKSYVFTAVWGNSMSHSQRENYRIDFDIQGAPTFLVYHSSGQYICTSRGGFGSVAAGKRLFSALEILLREPIGQPTPGPKACPSAT